MTYSTLHRTAPLLRSRNPMKRSAMPRPTKRMRHRSRKRQRLQDQWNSITLGKIALGMTCEVRIAGVCVTTPNQGHHILPVARGGKFVPENHALSCERCNGFLHQHENDPRCKGWILRGGGKP